MTVEFYHPHAAGIKEDDLVYIDRKYTSYAEISVETREKILADLRNGNETVRKYIISIMRRGVTDHIEIIKHTARKFFGPLNNIPDIDDNGNVNIETA